MRTDKDQLDSGLSRFGKRIALLTALLLSVFVSSSICVAQRQTRLTKIEFIGLQRLTHEQVLAASGLRIGQVVNPNVLDSATDKLMGSGLFTKVSYRFRSAEDEGIATFEVQEAAKGSTTPDVRTPDVKTPSVRPRSVRTSGVKTSVCSLHFPGAAAISEVELIRNSQPLINTDYSKEAVVNFARNTLLPLYRRIGRLRASFQEPTSRPETSGECVNGVAVTIPVEEGSVYFWDGAEWIGNGALSNDELSAALGMRAGEVADGLKIDKGIEAVRKVYSRKGHAAADVRAAAEFNDSARRVTYRFTVQEGSGYRMGNLIVTGLSPEDTRSLKRKWALAPGAVFDDSYLDDFMRTSVRELVAVLAQRTGRGLHSSAETKPNAQSQTVDVVISFN